MTSPAATPAPRGDLLPRLAALSRELGRPEHDYAIVAEGNTSVAASDDLFWCKASGTSLATADTRSFVLLRTRAVLELLDEPPPDDEQLGRALSLCRADPTATARPSVEAALHALCLTTGGAAWVGHTHPTAVNALLCSERAGLLVAGAVFPDQVVVCGSRPLLVPYADPGVPLALAVRERLAEHGPPPPKVIYLASHGLFALGDSPGEVRQVTAMAVKAARVLLGTLSAGGPRFLAPADVARLESRTDEHYRQAVLRGRGDR